LFSFKDKKRKAISFWSLHGTFSSFYHPLLGNNVHPKQCCVTFLLLLLLSFKDIKRNVFVFLVFILSPFNNFFSLFFIILFKAEMLTQNNADFLCNIFAAFYCPVSKMFTFSDTLMAPVLMIFVTISFLWLIFFLSLLIIQFLATKFTQNNGDLSFKILIGFYWPIS